MRLELSKEVWERKYITDSIYGFKVGRLLRRVCTHYVSLRNRILPHCASVNQGQVPLAAGVPPPGGPWSICLLSCRVPPATFKGVVDFNGAIQSMDANSGSFHAFLIQQMWVCPLSGSILQLTSVWLLLKHETTVACLEGKLNLFHAILDLIF